MAKVPSGQTIASYQSSLADKLNNSDNGLDKATNQAILSKTHNDKTIKQLKEKIELEQKSLDKLKEELQLADKLRGNHEEVVRLKKEIKSKQDDINKLNRQGVDYLEKTVSNIIDITSSYKKQLEYQTASLDKKLEMKRVEADELKSRLDVLEVLRKEGKLTSQMQKERKELQDKYEDARKKELSLEKSINDEQEKRMTFSQKRAAQEERIAKAQESLKQSIIKRDAVLNDKNATDTEKGLAIKQYNEEYRKISSTVKDNKYEQSMLKLVEKTGGKLDKISTGIFQVTSGLGKVANGFDKAIDDAMNVFSNYMGRVDARLYGTNLTFTKMQKDITKTLGASRYVSQQKMIDNLYKLTESGIAFNLEYRAWLETVSDRMVTTFDSLDTTLTRLVRLQQADISNASLGSEAILTKFLNSKFKDTSYLNNLYDSVAGILIDSTSQQSATNSIGYQFAIQKWLGALSSVGMSDNAVQSIATALNWLGSGNVSQLNSNTEAATLLNLSAQKAGLSYSDMLLNGTNEDNINKLMKAMVIQLQDISKNTKGNQVVKSAWGDILNFSMSDMRAINNLTNSDISSIYNTTANYSKSMSELNYQSSQLGKRTSIAQQIDNVVNNTLFGLGANVANNTGSYALWKGSRLVGDIGTYFGGTVETVASVLSLAGEVSALLSGVINNTDNVREVLAYFKGITEGGSGATGSGFGFQLYQSRGKGFTGVSGVSGGSSAKSVVTGTSYSGVASTASDVGGTASVNLTNNATKTKAKASTVTNNYSSVHDVGDIYTELFEKQTKSIKVNLVKISSSVVEDIAEAMHVSKIDSIEDVLTSGTVRTQVDNLSDIFASTANTIRYVQGL